MDPREARAIEIAAKFRIVESSGKWIVPSQSSSKKYAVSIVGQCGDCDCPDFELRREPCKHMLAVRFVIQRERNTDGSTTVTESFEVVKRTTYPQIWPAYNAAQTEEKDRFQVLLADLCSSIQEPIQTKGRPRVSLADQVFCATFKVYSGFSARRFASDLRESKERGLIGKAPHFNSVLNALENPDLRPILTSMIETSALPLKAVESDFAVDSSGFSVSRFERWFDHKHGGERFKREWVKVHIACGVRTNIVTAVEILGKDADDTTQLPPLLTTTKKTFDVKEVSGDKAYLSYNNTRMIAKAGATPFIAFKSNSGPGDFRKEGRGDS